MMYFIDLNQFTFPAVLAIGFLSGYLSAWLRFKKKK